MYVALNDEIWFPSPYMGEEDGFFAVGGDLSLPRLRLAYANGIFPWYAYKRYEEPYWCCPLRRFVIRPAEIHVSHSMRTLINKGRFQVTFDKCFARVMRNCRMVDNRDEDPHAWLGEHIIKAYAKLHARGMAHSVEVWDGETLVGGLYGVQMSKEVFVGESMFSHVPSGSKLALIALARKLAQEGGVIIDCQCHTQHLESMGGRYMTYAEYIDILHSGEGMADITRYGLNGFLYLNKGRGRCLSYYSLTGAPSIL